jgi:S1-C subfamily serine protease
MRRALPLVATGLAAVAVLLAVIAVVSVTNRSGSATAATPATPVPQAPVTPPPAPPPQIAEVQIEATKLGKLFSAETTDSPFGLLLSDPALVSTLGLQPGDALTMIQGVRLDDPFQLHTAIMDLALSHTSRWYLEIVRAGQPLLVRYTIGGDISAAIRAQVDTMYNAPPPPPPAAAPDPMLDTITKVDDDHYEIPKKTVDAYLASPDPMNAYARITASIKNGQPNGVKLYAIRPSSPLTRLGFQNGDTLRAVNGIALDLDALLNKFPRDGTLVFDITRRGVDQTLTITITP